MRFRLVTLSTLHVHLGGLTQHHTIQFRVNLLLATIVAVFFLAVPTPATGQEVASREAELKGKVVGVLGKLVTWPAMFAPTANNPLTVGILGSNPFVDGNGVDHLQRKLGPKTLIITYAKADDIKGCHILVVAKDADFKAALAKVKGLPILILAESPGLARQGAAVNLILERNTIRVKINPKTAYGAGLAINPGLLRSPIVDIVR